MKSADPYLRRPNEKIELCGLKLPLELMYRGCLITGAPGTGKTKCVLVPLLNSILQTTGTNPDEKCAMLLSDPKNELADIVAEMLARVGRADDLIIVKPGASHFNPFANPLLSESEIPEKIISWANNTHKSAERRARGESEFWANSQRALLAALVSTTRSIHGVLNFTLLNEVFRQVCRFDGATEATRWLKNVNAPKEAIQGICDFLSLPRDTTKPCVASSVSGVLYLWDREPLRSLTTPDESTTAVDPINAIHTGKVVVIGCSGAAYGSSITPLTLALKESFLTALLSRDQIEVQEKDEWKLINQVRPTFVVADEFQEALCSDPSTGELVCLDRLRGFRAGMICATQTISALISVLGDVHHANRLISLLSNQVFLGNLCPATAIQAEHILGRKKVREFQKDCSPQIAPPTIFRQSKTSRKYSGKRTVEFSRDVPRVDAAALARLRTGECWIRTADGRIHKKRAPLPQF